MYVDEDYNDYIQEKFERAIHKNKDKLSSCQHELIPNTYIYLNSLNLFIGKQRAGKSGAIIKEIIKICDNSPETHLLVYVNKSGKEDDVLFESTKKLIPIPILYVSHKESVNALRKIFEYKHAYKSIKLNRLEDEVPEQYIDQIDRNLYVKDFSLPFLHTLIFFEDTANSPLLKDKFILDVMGRCAHHSVTCFLASQFWKSIPSTLKENVSTIFFYGGATNREFYYLLSQVNIEEDHKELYNAYKRLDVTDKMIIDNYTRQIIFTDRKH